MPASIRTLSQLPAIKSIELQPESKFEVSLPVEISVGQSGQILKKFASKSIAASELTERISNDIIDTLSVENGFTKEMRFDDLCAIVNDIGYGNFAFDGHKSFNEDPIIDNSPLSSYSLSNDELNGYSVNYETLKRFSNINSSPTIGPNFGFVTRLSGSNSDRLLTIFKPHELSGGGWSFSPEPYFVFDTNTKNVFPNEYVFKIERGERSSKSWKAPASGIFTCYGWLDEINNPSQSNESRWVALMGYQTQIQKWTILQIQPFIKNNYLSYVSFTFPVRKGMELKVMTGFAVGSNSDKYFASNSSITNHVPNAFIGGVYTGLSAWNETGDSYATEEISNDYVTSAMLTNYVTREEEDACDLSVNEALSALSSQLSNAINGNAINEISAELSTKVSYIDTNKYASSNPWRASLMMYDSMFTPSDAGYDSSYHQTGMDQNGNWSATAPLFHVRLEDIAGYTYRSYYAPPTFAETRSDGETGYVEKAYTQSAEPPYGKVFSDGKFMFYCIKSDCTAVIRIYPDFTSHMQSGIAGYMLCPRSPWTRIYAVTLGKYNEAFGNLTDSCGAITLPVKKGTIFMFCPWHTEAISDGRGNIMKALKNEGVGKLPFLELNAPCVIPGADNGAVLLSSLYNGVSTNFSGPEGSYKSTVDINGTKYPYMSYAIWTGQRDQRDKLVDETGNTPGKFTSLFGTNGRQIASIVELT